MIPDAGRIIHFRNAAWRPTKFALFMERILTNRCLFHREMIATNCLKSSIRRRFRVMTQEKEKGQQSTPGEGGEDAEEDAGLLSVEDCIAIVNELVDEVETETVYYAPGYQGHLSRAKGVAVLEFVRCCRERVEEVEAPRLS